MIKRIAALLACIAIAAMVAAPAFADGAELTTQSYKGLMKSAVAKKNVAVSIDEPLRGEGLELSVSFKKLAASEYSAAIRVSIYRKEGAKKAAEVYRDCIPNTDDGHVAIYNEYSWKPNTKYIYTIKYEAVGFGYKGQRRIVLWSPPAKVKRSDVKASGGTAAWKRQKNVSGYVVQYTTDGHSYKTKAVKGCKASYSGELVAVYPYTKHGGYYYAKYRTPYKTAKAMLKALRYNESGGTPITVYRRDPAKVWAVFLR